jgi:hypothetical protein
VFFGTTMLLGVIHPDSMFVITSGRESSVIIGNSFAKVNFFYLFVS